MGQLTNSFVVSDQPTMSSRDIADVCGARHNDVIATIGRLFAKGVLRESRNTLRGHNPEGGGRPTEVYDLTERDTLVVVSGYKDEVRAKIIDQWQALKARAAPPPAVALNDPAALRAALLGYTEKVIALEAAKVELEHRVEQDAPKVAFAERIAALPGSVSVASAAQTLGTGQNRLFAFMRTIGWLQKSNAPYQHKIDDGCLENKPSPYLHPRDGSLQHSYTTLVTAKGLVRLQRAWSGRQAERASAAA